ncbi:DNA replication/checkpoint protein [Microdochium trichocladiopsis]|uniref:DNA replication regulator SLD2 n=1 Tax=Microdochium trichocladiopsis TaxID=1682393 RepID=A0A9P8XXJ6_9PEZI|nr:DNA replication/checkpoint protein [Microdochium trichocladiopsis]KAH7018327.1 DNA replication/checkpoint protein [Microdochium trichocladiopsis]
MDEDERRGYEATAQKLRADLKQFENDWAASHGGSKPGREDIKANPDIANAYKKYNKVRDILSGKIVPPKKPANSQKRRPDPPTLQTPSKRSRHAETPSKVRTVNVEPDLATPSTRKLFSPVAPTSIGPTPQKDGRILGLFDLMSGGEQTPSKPSSEAAKKPVTIQATPTKRKASDMEDEEENTRLGRTPMSSSKRAMLDTFLTPLKRRDANAGTKTPQTVRKLEFSTPAFLRRAPLPPVDENGGYRSPEPLRLPRKPFGRGLSSVVASLRKMEEDHLDEDLEALRELEAGEAPAPVKSTSAPATKPDVLAPDSQGPQLLGGFDDEAQFDSDPEKQVGRDGLPLKIYQKKGQKRTTRRVNMRPTRTKRPAVQSEAMLSDDDEVVEETQVNVTAPGDSDPLDLGSDSEFGDSGNESASERAKKRSKAAKGGDGGKKEKEGKVKQVVKKISATAHANFQRLKLKNYGAKGGPGFNSRFRRKR